jgi:HSP20 family protein
MAIVRRFHFVPWREFAREAGSSEDLEEFAPDFEVKETKDAFLFNADLPGVDEDDLDISLTDNRLTISGKREAERKKEGETFYAYERAYGSFTRTFTLPREADTENCDAQLKNGVLTLRLPKKREEQSRKINIRSNQKSGGKD